LKKFAYFFIFLNFSTLFTWLYSFQASMYMWRFTWRLHFEALKKEVEKLRTELSMLFLERDDLIYQECKNIDMAYMLAVGALEYKAFELDCMIRRQKRKSELIQAKKNRQEKISVTQINNALDVEFAEYQAMLNEQVEKMNAALERSHGTLLSEEESRELKKLYRAIVKVLHPDLHPDLSDAQAQLFLNAVEAYEHGDLNGLRIISTMVVDPVIPGTVWQHWWKKKSGC
jgi:hypothetical protein